MILNTAQVKIMFCLCQIGQHGRPRVAKMIDFGISLVDSLEHFLFVQML